MKILHIISSGGMYGAEAVILNMSRMLREGGHTSMLGVFDNASNPNLQLYDSAVKNGIAAHLIPCSGQIDRRVVGKIRELARETQADVVHAHGYKADLYVYLALKASFVPTISTCHNWLKDGFLVNVYGALDRWVLRSFSAVVAVSNEVRQTLLHAGVKTAKIRLIPNGIDLRPFDGAAPTLRTLLVDSSTLLVGIVGRLSKEKGVDLFLRAAARVLSQLPNVMFVVVGDGPERETLETLIDELNIRDKVSMLGRREDMAEIYASMDVMISSSHQEGLPMTILEGMASGRAWIATAVGDVPTIVVNDQTGVLIPAGNIEILATELVALLGDQGRRKRLGDAGKLLVEREFSAQTMTNRYLGVYTEAIEDKQMSHA